MGETMRWHVAGWSETDVYVVNPHGERFYGGPKNKKSPEFGLSLGGPLLAYDLDLQESREEPGKCEKSSKATSAP